MFPVVYVEKHYVEIFFKKLKASHTYYRVLDPKLIPVYRQSAHR